MIRPEIRLALHRIREVLAAGALLLAGLWLAAQGGALLLPAGAILAVAAAGWAVTALRRMRFAQAVAAPGMVEVNEGQVAYLGPAFGGFAALDEVTEIRLLTMRGRRLWRLAQADGKALLVPVDAAGADTLFDAFAALPGMDTRILVAALDGKAAAPASSALVAGPRAVVVWRRAGTAIARG